MTTDPATTFPGRFAKRSRRQPGVARHRAPIVPIDTITPGKDDPPANPCYPFAADRVLVREIRYRVTPDAFQTLRRSLGLGAKATNRLWPSPPPQHGRDARDLAKAETSRAVAPEKTVAPPVPSLRPERTFEPSVPTPSSTRRHRSKATFACLMAAVCGTAYFAIPMISPTKDPVPRSPSSFKPLSPPLAAVLPSPGIAPAVATAGIAPLPAAAQQRSDVNPGPSLTATPALTDDMTLASPAPAPDDGQPVLAASQASADTASQSESLDTQGSLPASSASSGCSNAHEALGLCNVVPGGSR